MPNTTAIIPCRIDSPTRLRNIHVTVKYLLKHTDMNLIITECDDQQKIFLEKNNRIDYRFKKNTDRFFHRTKLINEMLFSVKTPIVANYDADVLLPPDSYKFAEKLIIEDNNDLVYPYGFEQFDQIKIPDDESNKKFRETVELKDLVLDQRCIGWCRYGHVQFFKTEAYRSGFMENENYRHFCPEDEERGVRFQKLGYKVVWFKNWILHQEHPPTPKESNVNIDSIHELHRILMSSDKEQLTNYYSNQDYLKKYKS